jgi:hypothetical protein
MGDHDGHAPEGYLFTLMMAMLQGTRGGHGAALGWAAGAEVGGRVAAAELPRAGQREPGPQDTWRLWSCPGLGSGSRGRWTHGGCGAAPGYVVHIEAMGTWSCVTACLAFCLDLKLVCGGTRSAGYRQWLPGPSRVRQ